MRLIAILLAATVCCVPAFGQTAKTGEGLDISGSIRVRYEALDGQIRPGLATSDDIYSIRSTLALSYRTGPVTFGAEMFDSRIYDATRTSAISTSEVNVLEPVQAYAGLDLGDALGKGSKLNLQLGRFILNLGSRRLVAADDYRNTTNGYTGLRADFRTKAGLDATLIYTLPQMRRPDRLDNILDNEFALDRESTNLRLWGAVIGQAVGKRNLIELSFMRLQEEDGGRRLTRDRNLFTVGGRYMRKPQTGAADVEVEGFYQFGSVSADASRTARELDVSAWFFHADAGYSLSLLGKTRLSLEFDYASGDTRGDRFTRFDTLFGMRRADLSPAGLLAAIGRTNIVTPGFRIETEASTRTDGFVSGRALWAASASDQFATTGIRDASGRSGRFAGYQLEARVRHWLIPKRLRAEVNGVLLLERGLLRDAPNARSNGDTRYVSLALTASF